jgi:RNA polymerase sigma factor (sigma-70 family)
MRKVLIYADRQLERLFVVGTAAGMTNAQLVEQFVSGDSESAALAFEAIVKRHGPMVLRICRVILQDVHAADDAFQATFLVLARKARHLRASDLLGNWLHGVAVRTARKAKAISTHRRICESQVKARIPAAVQEPQDDLGHADLEQILHEEIDRLPYSYRAAIVICYLEGFSQAEAAQRLRLAESTIRGRLARARKLLGRRLVRRGVGPSAGLTALGYSANTAGLLPSLLARATARSALSFLNRDQAIPSVVSATARDIANGVLLAMRFSPLNMIGVMIMALGLVGAGITVMTQQRALARVQPEEAQANTITPVETAHVQSTGGASEQVERERKQSQPADVPPDLVKLAPGPIIRTIPVSKDCMVLSYLPDWNFGNVDNIGIGNNDGGVRTLIDWPGISPDEAAAPARQFLIALYSRKTISHPPASVICVFEIAEEWPERTSWKTQPKYEPEPAATCKFEPGDGWKLFDVTPLVRARAKAGRNGHGVVLRFLKEDVSGGLPEVFSDYKLVSREGAGQWVDHQPVLLVVKAMKPPSPPSK